MGKSKGYHPKNHAALLLVPEDAVKKDMTCLGCGKPMFTDRCHRMCSVCRRRPVVSANMGRGHRVSFGGDAGDTRDGGSIRKASLMNHVEPSAGMAVEVLGGMGRRALS